MPASCGTSCRALCPFARNAQGDGPARPDEIAFGGLGTLVGVSDPNFLGGPSIDRALILTLIEEIRGLRSDFRSRQTPTINTSAPGRLSVSGAQGYRELVRCICDHIQDDEGNYTLFSANELVNHARVVEQAQPLRNAIIESVGALNAKKLGNLLKRRIAGIEYDGRVIERVGRDGNGVVWKVTLCI
jgi:hypothetical protein